MTPSATSVNARKVESLGGMIAAIVVPLTDAHEIDLPALGRYAGLVSRQGVDGIVINSDAGEGAMLTQEQRAQALDTVVLAIDGRMPVISGLPAQATPKVVAEAHRAAEAGADALLVFPTPAFRGASASRTDVIVGYHEEIAAAGLPLIAFHLDTALGGTLFSDETLLALADCPAVIALKDASFDPKVFVRVRDVLRSAQRQIALLTGNDTFILESLLLGAHGALLGLGSICTQLQVNLVRAVTEGRLADAQALGRKVDDLARATFGPPQRDYQARIKRGLVEFGVFTRANVIPPFPEASSKDSVELARVLRELGTAGAFMTEGLHA